MNLQEALDILTERSITTSQQMLRRWIRQGKIKATLPSKKEGYIIDPKSLDQFIEQKEKTSSNSPPKDVQLQQEYDWGWQEGYNQAKQNRDSIIAEILRKQEKQFLAKGFYEEQYSYTHKELAASKKMTVALDQFLTLLEIKEVTINVIGSNARVENTLEMIDLRYLDYPNKRLKTRLRDTFLEIMLDNLKKEQSYQK